MGQLGIVRMVSEMCCTRGSPSLVADIAGEGVCCALHKGRYVGGVLAGGEGERGAAAAAKGGAFLRRGAKFPTARGAKLRRRRVVSLVAGLQMPARRQGAASMGVAWLVRYR